MVPGEPSSIVDFVERLGLSELLAWVFEKPDGPLAAAWEPVVLPTAGHPSAHLIPQFVEYGILVDAWADPATVEAFTDEQELLRRGTASKSAYAVVDHRWRSDEDSLPIVIMVDAMGIIYERPRHIFARAWYEVLDKSHATRVCGYCRTPSSQRGQTRFTAPAADAVTQPSDRNTTGPRTGRSTSGCTNAGSAELSPTQIGTSGKKEHQPKEAEK